MNKYLTLFLILFIPTNSLALIEVDITRGNLNPLPIAVSPLSIDNESKQNFEEILKKKNIGLEISSVIENNLKTVNFIDPPTHLTFDKSKLEGTVKNYCDRSELLLDLNELLVIEYYSRR